MKFSMDNETRSDCPSDKEQKRITNVESSLPRTTEEIGVDRTTIDIVEQSVDSVNSSNEIPNPQKGIFTRVTYNRWKCVFLHNSTMFYCSICDAQCRSYQKLKQHRLLQHRAVTFLDQFKPNCCELTFSTRNAAHHHLSKCSSSVKRLIKILLNEMILI
mgnify:CR=1 FL=1